MDLKGIMFSEIKQTEENKHCMVSFICEIFFKKVKFIETGEHNTCQGLGNGKIGTGCKRAQTLSYR